MILRRLGAVTLPPASSEPAVPAPASPDDVEPPPAVAPPVETPLILPGEVVQPSKPGGNKPPGSSTGE
jgi:hypothetical protein